VQELWKVLVCCYWAHWCLTTKKKLFTQLSATQVKVALTACLRADTDITKKEQLQQLAHFSQLDLEAVKHKTFKEAYKGE
jgi:hypothetical protein